MDILFEESAKRSAAYDGEKNIGECTYVEEDGVWTLNHTAVDQAYGGQGIARKLLTCLVEEARKRSVKIIPVCSYVAREFEKHPDLYGDVLNPGPLPPVQASPQCSLKH